MLKSLPVIECLPVDEMVRRHNLCRTFLTAKAPSAHGLLVFSSLNIYYLTGTWACGFLYLPCEGEALLCVYDGEERCRLESPLSNVVTVPTKNCATSSPFSVLPHICHERGIVLGDVLATEMAALPWALATKLQEALPKHTFVEGDSILLRARARKSAWELRKMRLAGERHNRGLCDILPQRMTHGMSEQDIARVSWQVFLELGHSGISRMGNFGEECFLGHIAVGDNGNYPSHFNGPLGLRGVHPATPYMGCGRTVWQKGDILALDIGFTLEGYHTDKTQVYFAGRPEQIPYAVRKAHDACIDIQARAAEGLRCGAVPAVLWEEARQRAKFLGVEEGFMGLGGNKVPFLGHGIGLVIDEYPVLAARFEEPLEEGMVLAIEPKVGLPHVGMVGVENTFEVCPQGGRSLSGDMYDIVCVP